MACVKESESHALQPGFKSEVVDTLNTASPAAIHNRSKQNIAFNNTPAYILLPLCDLSSICCREVKNSLKFAANKM